MHLTAAHDIVFSSGCEDVIGLRFAGVTLSRQIFYSSTLHPSMQDRTKNWKHDELKGVYGACGLNLFFPALETIVAPSQCLRKEGKNTTDSFGFGTS